MSLCGELQARRTPWSFAIVIDSVSYAQTRSEVQDYVRAIEETNHFKVHTLIDCWGVPDSIRHALHTLYRSSEAPLCGAVFIGDIPVPMVRDAQHLTSAFKMDQRIDRRESSVASDRFYDDFDLRFDTLGHDAGTPYYYYTLRADSPQRLASDIFTGRIRPTDTTQGNRYDKLRRYLRKAVLAKRQPRPLDQLFYFTGNGTLNESKVASIDEKLSWYEHFPWFAGGGEHITYMDYADADTIKFRMMSELMRPDLDFAVLHHHGEYDTQYLSSPAPAHTMDEARLQLLRMIRQRLDRQTRRTANRDSVVQAFCTKNRIPVEWVNEAYAPERQLQDSLAETRLNLTLDDFTAYGYAPNCRMVVFDACFNGAFHESDCIANAYIFAPGETLVAIGGTVNLIQDKWYDRMAGLLGSGLCAGYFNLFQNYLESHLIGDPTFAFAPSSEVKALNETVASVVSGGARKFRLNGAETADLQVLRMELLARTGQISSAELLDAVKHSPYGQVRMQGLQLLAKRGGEDFVQAIAAATSDPVEMVQRLAVNYIRKNGDPRLAAPLIRLYLRNSASARVAFNAQSALMFFPREVLLPEFNRQAATLKMMRRDEYVAQKCATVVRTANYWSKEIDELSDPKLRESQFDLVAAAMRLYCPHDQVERLFRYIETCDRPDRQIRLLEALGWMEYSYRAPFMAQEALRLSQDSRLAPEVRNEALKTFRRLSPDKP